ncbi:hypothetical protein MKW92_002064 [Papaver armeniacum]|nr:hypothetical protein MKW92_002064 [Papaver armeniacum]
MEIEFPRITEDEDFLQGLTTRRKIYKYPIEESAEGRTTVAPVIKLEEDVLFNLQAKLYGFDKDGNKWKERGNGFIKLLKHKETKKFRLVMRQSRTLKVIANHLVLQRILVQEHTGSGSQKSWAWHVVRVPTLNSS